MTLKSLTLTRAENLTKELRAEYKLPDFGLVAIETTNPELKQDIKHIKTGFSDYLLSLGDFIDVDINE